MKIFFSPPPPQNHLSRSATVEQIYNIYAYSIFVIVCILIILMKQFKTKYYTFLISITSQIITRSKRVCIWVHHRWICHVCVCFQTCRHTIWLRPACREHLRQLTGLMTIQDLLQQKGANTSDGSTDITLPLPKASKFVKRFCQDWIGSQYCRFRGSLPRPGSGGNKQCRGSYFKSCQAKARSWLKEVFWNESNLPKVLERGHPTRVCLILASAINYVCMCA